MLKKHIFIREDQNKALELYPGTFSEKVRIAIDEYIKSHYPLPVPSPSGVMKGGEYGEN